MPLFLPEYEFEVIKASGDVSAAAEAADAFVKGLLVDLETVKAGADAATITAEQTCSLLEQKYLSLSSEYSSQTSRNSELDSALQQRVSELAHVQVDKHQLHIKLIQKDGEIEHLTTELKELQKSKRQLVELVGLKDVEISEKESKTLSYLDKITDLTDHATEREARLSELEAESVRCRASCGKLSQEKELVEKHNAWLNDELTVKVDSLLEQRRRSADMEADMSAKLADMEKQYNECSSSLIRQKERVRELETKLESVHQELCSAKDEASAAEKRYSAEISTVSKLVDLYKENSEEWSKKAGELEGVIKALETHLNQIESDYRDKLEKEASARKEAEKLSTELKKKLAKCEAELEAGRKSSELDVLTFSSFTAKDSLHTASGNNLAGGTHAIVPHVPAGVSGTALAASLIREGWSLAKMYAKYQEAADALRHEQLGRKQTQAILERVLMEIEEKASVILDERVEHQRMAEAYALMNQKLQQSLFEQANLEKVIQDLKADLKRRGLEYDYAQKEITDLQQQVTIILNECHDIQLRRGSVNHEYVDDYLTSSLTEVGDQSDAQKVISEHLLSVKDIKGLVEQNAQLRTLVRSLSDEIENRETQLKEQFEEELQKHKEEAASKVAAILERAENQGRMIESLHCSVAMYRRLYEEQRLRSSHPQSSAAPSTDDRKELMLLLEGSQEATKKIQEQASERVHCLEEELATQKGEIRSLRAEREKLTLEANFAQEKLKRFMKDFDHQREEMNEILARNIEFYRLIVDYQKNLRETSESLHLAEELSRKLNTELSVLKREKELLVNSEKRALDEVQDMSQRLYRLQATLDTIQSGEQIREEARFVERRKQEDYLKQIEREWAEAKKELLDERNNVRTLSLDREHTIKDAMRQVEDLGKELAAALQTVTAAETRAAVAEARYSDLERNLKSSEGSVTGKGGVQKPSSSSVTEIIGDSRMTAQEIERLKAEAQGNKEHMLQYKSIAEVNEAALKQMEGAHETFRIQSEQLKKSLEAEIESLRNQIHEFEKESRLKVNEATSAVSQKDRALASALEEITSLKEETSNKVSQISALEVQVTVLKGDLEKEHQQVLAAQANYERQVILHSKTIQELKKTSQALASLQEEASALRTMVDAYRSKNNELNAKSDVEKSEIEKSKSEAEKKYAELNEQNRILHSQLEAMHMKLAEEDGVAVGATFTSTCSDSPSETGLHGVVSYLRRSKEIAETEISLLKQEKLHLQTQLERALKAAEAAEASLNEERASSRDLLFTEDEFKALKLQVGEMNLLRESNMQLREENRHNFEGCQKLRELAKNAKVEAENLQSLLREVELEDETLRREIELQRKEKEDLEQRISEAVEGSLNISLEDYNLLKSEMEQMQSSIREKDIMIEEMRKHVSEKDESISKLEQDFACTKSELAEREERLSQVEAQKLEFEKQKKFVLQLRRRVDLLLKDKELLSKEKESLLKEKESLTKEMETLLKEKESLFREKEELSKEKHAFSRQLEDLHQEKKPTVDVPVDPAMREKEKEKDARIQILEHHLGRLREDNKKEKERRANIEKVIVEKVKILDQERKRFEAEHGKHKEAVRKISIEVEKLKHARDSLPEGTSVVQFLSGSTLDEIASAYVLAVENFEREANSIFNDSGNQTSAGNSSAMKAAPAVAISTQAPLAELATSSMAPPTHPPAKAAEEREKLVSLPKSSVETRKTGRKLVRPRLVKTEEPPRDAVMSELDGARDTGKPALAQEITMQSSVPTPTEPSIRKRSASSFASEMQGESCQPVDSGTDIELTSLKRSKGSESMQEDIQAQSFDPENAETVPAAEEFLDAAAEPRVSTDEGSDMDKDDIETTQRLEMNAKESRQLNDANQLDVLRINDFADHDHAVRLSEADPLLDERSNFQYEQDTEPIIDAAEREEGELLAEGSGLDGVDDMAINAGSIDVTEVQPEHTSAGAASMPSPARIGDNPLIPNSPEMSHVDEKNDKGEVAKDVAEGSDKSTDDQDQIVGDGENSNEAGSVAAESNPSAVVDSTISREDIPSIIPGPNEAQSSHSGTSTTTITLSERAKERAAARLGRFPAASMSRRGRIPLTRGRGGRASHGGRRQSSGDQG